MRSPTPILAVLVLCICHASAQTMTNAPAATDSPHTAIGDEAKNVVFLGNRNGLHRARQP
jgi:hypothetical protein